MVDESNCGESNYSMTDDYNLVAMCLKPVTVHGLHSSKSVFICVIWFDDEGASVLFTSKVNDDCPELETTQKI
ncbi:hypothetical protein BLOT_006323, partial [Blomia tropicalis]